MINPRIILNKLKWQKDFDFKKIKVIYIHRGAENDRKIISGENIVDIQRSFMKTDTSMIPFHRITKIIYKNKIFFQRKKDK